MQSRTVPQISIITASFIWGISNIFVELALDFLDPLAILVLRFGTAVILLNFYLVRYKSRKYYQLLYNRTCVFLGWLGAAGYFLGTVGQDMTSVGLATLLSTSYIVLIPIILLITDKRRLSAKELLTISVALAGIILITFNGKIENLFSFSAIGIALMLLQALQIGYYVIASEKFLSSATRENKEVDLLAYLSAIVTHVFTGLLILSTLIPARKGVINAEIVLITVFLAIFPTLVAYSLYNWAVTRLGSVKTAFYLLLQVVVPLLYDLIINMELFSPYNLVGILLVLSSIIILEMVDIQDIRDFFLRLIRIVSVPHGPRLLAPTANQET